MADKIEGIGYRSFIELYSKGKIHNGKYIVVSDHGNYLTYEICSELSLKFNNLMLYSAQEVIDNNKWYI